MPLHNPSPRRFLAPNPPPTQNPKTKPQSGLRNGFAAALPHNTTDLPVKKPAPAKRFVITPHRRTHSGDELKKSEQKANEAPVTTHTQHAPRPKIPRKFERVESIETLQSSPIALPDDVDQGSKIVKSIENDCMVGVEAQQDHDHDEEELLFVTEERNKRRRVSPRSTPPHHRSDPSTPHHHTTHRFIVPPPRTPAPFGALPSQNQPHATTPASVPHRPAFLLPPQPTSPPKPAKPLPEIFSPSRKNQKYVPDGMAATMQTWIVETAHTGFAAQERNNIIWARDKEDGVKLKLRVSAISSSSSSGPVDEFDCYPNAFVFVHGETEPGIYNASRAPESDDMVRILLAGQGGTRGAAVKIRTGAIVGVKAPMWDIDVDGVKWVVGVDWVVL